MTIPVTDDMKRWAEAYTESVRYVAQHTGQPFDANAATTAIRRALTEPRAFDGRDLFEPDVDDWVTGVVADEGADRLEARETRAREWQA